MTPSPASLTPRARIDTAKLGWVTGELALASYAGVAILYLLYYATEVLHLPAAWAGIAMFVPRLWNILGDPIVGVLSDRTHSRFGRRRPYLFAGALIWGAAFWLLFNLPPVKDPFARACLFSFVFLLNNTGLTLFQVPYAAMLAEFSPDSAVRTRLAAYREVAARVAILLTLACAPRVLAGASDPATGFSHVGAIFGAVITLSGIIAFFATAGAPATSLSPSHGSAKLQLAPIVENRPFASITLAFLFVNLGDAVFSGSLVYYVTEVMRKSPAIIGVLYPVSSLTGIASTPLWTLAANRLGRARVCRVAFAGNALCCVLPVLFGAEQVWLMYPFMSLYGFFNTGARLLPNAMVPDTVDLDRVRTGKNREGVFFGVFVFTQQTAFAAGGFILSLLLTLAGVGGAEHGAGRVTGIVICFTVASAVLYGSAFVASLFYRLNPNDLLNVQAPRPV
jgi:GPH family glycoside/pentoside/hexuronide:cation symporter